MAIKRVSNPSSIFRKRTDAVDQNQDVKSTADRFMDRYNGKEASVETRKAETTDMVNEYYDLVTDFYEYGWGQSFHFAPRYVGESFYEGLARHEYYLALQGGFKRGMKLLDIGCGVGGPARNISRFTGAEVMGINNNAYQISRARKIDSQLGLSHLVNYTRTDFCNMPFEDNSYDGAYAIEATCHATDKVKCFSEIFRVLKPGARFVCYEWVVTDKYDDTNEEHRRIRHGIELGDGLPTLETGKMVVDAMEKSGFVVEDAFDKVELYESSPPKNITWYNPLEASYTSLSGVKASPIGRFFTMQMCSIFEKIGIAPKGSRKAADILEEGAANLVLGGRLGIFTPSFFVQGHKPE
eukprot:Tbor_TRINITY_DN5685_c0_g1::TRINITY_DN5685_c0_g1_i5::g.8463::m.8463/K00559/E2.1.1.41, SMT1, ERG6; sterol 24-C-methyltransferase